MKKVKQEVLDLINNVETRTKIAALLTEKTGKFIGDGAVYSAMRKNSIDGRMTKVDFLEVVSSVTGIGILDILEDVKQVA